ncbi:MAG TPA: calcium-binding protein [Actinomycetota bacterium]|nr:calcium-binding protein [Actinomycetota bacterium]
MRRKISVLLFTSCFVVAAAAPAFAQIVPDFFSGSGGTAGFSDFGRTDNQSVELFIPDADAFAGFELTGIDDTAPATAPSFWFYSTVSSTTSGGSPRMVITFSDGGTMEFRPLSWQANTWTLVDGSQNLWDNNGGTCGFLFGVSYETALACHAGATVTSVHIVTDSGWVVSPYTHFIDDVIYEGETIGTIETCNGLAATITGDGVVTGTPGDDVIVTGDGGDVVRGLGGNDTICSGGGSDLVRAGAGNDTVFAGTGNDQVIGGDGNDRIDGESGNDALAGNAGTDTLLGGPGNDQCNGGAGIDTAVACEATPNVP